MRRMLTLALFGFALCATPALARERCDVPSEGVHIKVTVGFGHRDYETQQQFDAMALRKVGVNPRSVTRTGDGCIEAFIANGDGTFRTEYFDPRVLDGVGEGLKLTLD